MIKIRPRHKCCHFQKSRIAKRLTKIEQEIILNIFEESFEIIKPNIKLEEVKDDPADNKFIECAVCASVDYVISGDEHLLKLKEFRGIKVVTPSEFVNILDV